MEKLVANYNLMTRHPQIFSYWTIPGRTWSACNSYFACQSSPTLLQAYTRSCQTRHPYCSRYHPRRLRSSLYYLYYCLRMHTTSLLITVFVSIVSSINISLYFLAKVKQYDSAYLLTGCFSPEWLGTNHAFQPLEHEAWPSINGWSLHMPWACHLDSLSFAPGLLSNHLFPDLACSRAPQLFY